MIQRLVAIQIAVTDHFKKIRPVIFFKLDKQTVLEINNDFPAKSSRGFDGISMELQKIIDMKY